MTGHSYRTDEEAVEEAVAVLTSAWRSATAEQKEDLRWLFNGPHSPARDPYEDSVVYYVENHGLIKIGTSYEVERRARVLGGQLLATEPGSYDLERQRHCQFAGSRVGRTEWFQPTAALRRHIAGLAGGGGRSPLPPPATSWLS